MYVPLFSDDDRFSLGGVWVYIFVVYNVFLAPYRDTDLHWRGDRCPAAPEVHLAHLPCSPGIFITLAVCFHP